ncbi:uncharacterized protein LOC124916058 [Impatiens glandulifera]|uniref:uncharacterized protein LOC124916058 n=1 Tax=Impatiens glandulifera TaxID=253017 RepID=UPI001FB16563|nr:uncharacterized protein LOC124916058 [Impatiens glandulifera]
MAKKDSNTKNTKLIIITRYIKAPFRVLAKARDFYIQSMTQCAGQMAYGTSSMAKSFSVNSNRSINDDYSDLIRVASTRTLGEKIESELLRRQQESTAVAAAITMTRSQSVAIGRIDEDKPCDFGDDLLFLRSRSYAVSKRPTFFS